MRVTDVLQRARLTPGIEPLATFVEDAGKRQECRGVIALRGVGPPQAFERHRRAAEVVVLALENFGTPVIRDRAFEISVEILHVGGADQRCRDQRFFVQPFLDRQSFTIQDQGGRVVVGGVTNRRNPDQGTGNPVVIGHTAFQREPLLVRCQCGREVTEEIEAVGDVLEHLPFRLPISDGSRDFEPSLIEAKRAAVLVPLGELIGSPADRINQP